jgi:V/A-type H+/Na+-transporting ATPase subunit E
LSVKNGISEIANEVVGDIQKIAEASILKAETEAKETLKVAKEHADQNYQTIISQASAKAEAEKLKRASVTEVEMRNHLLQIKEDLVDGAFEKALVKLKNFVKTKEYRSYLLKLIVDTAKKIGKKDLVIQVNAKDKRWLTPDKLKSLTMKAHCDFLISEKTADFLGGCIIQSADFKIIYNNTLDNRLQEFKPILRIEIAKMLFGDEIRKK